MKKLIPLLGLLPCLVIAQTFTYDDAGRVVGAVYAGGTEIGYEYDKAANIIAVTSTAGAGANSGGDSSDGGGDSGNSDDGSSDDGSGNDSSGGDSDDGSGSGDDSGGSDDGSGSGDDSTDDGSGDSGTGDDSSGSGDDDGDSGSSDGDTGGTTEPPATNIPITEELDRSNGEQSVLVFTVSVSIGDASLHSITVQSGGDISDTGDIQSVALYYDADDSGSIDTISNSERIAVSNYTSGSRELTFTLNNPLQLPAGTSRFFITYEFQ